jgi:hypothetical protein
VRRILLAVFYYLAITPWGRLHGLIGDPLARRPHPEATTYWHFVDGD